MCRLLGAIWPYMVCCVPAVLSQFLNMAGVRNRQIGHMREAAITRTHERGSAHSMRIERGRAMNPPAAKPCQLVVAAQLILSVSVRE